MSTLPRLSNTESLGAARGGPALVLRIEGLAALVAACVVYSKLGGSWGWFAALFLVPDLSMLGYLINTKVGAASYNTAHSTLGGLALAAVGVALGSNAMLLGASIWIAHVGFDRMLGYGLKYASAFGDTHLGLKGRRSVDSASLASSIVEQSAA
jgi:hypothetical protein